MCPLLIKFTIANHGYYTRGAFHLITKLQFEIPNISCSDWDSIFRLVSVSRPSWTIHLHEFRFTPKQNEAEMVDSVPRLFALSQSMTAHLKQTSFFMARQEHARAVEVDRYVQDAFLKKFCSIRRFLIRNCLLNGRRPRNTQSFTATNFKWFLSQNRTEVKLQSKLLLNFGFDQYSFNLFHCLKYSQICREKQDAKTVWHCYRTII